MPRAGLSTAVVVSAALDIVDEASVNGLTLAAVASRTGVAAPSLYKHVANLAALRDLVGARVLDDMTAHLAAAVLGRAGDDAVAALMHAARGYVRIHPRRYAAMPPDPLRLPATAESGARLLEVFLAVLRGYGLDRTGAIHATRSLRAIVHGFTSIEVSGGFGLPEELDTTYRHLIRMFIASLPGPR